MSSKREQKLSEGVAPNVAPYLLILGLCYPLARYTPQQKEGS
jgi:hypothetical protein